MSTAIRAFPRLAPETVYDHICGLYEVLPPPRLGFIQRSDKLTLTFSHPVDAGLDIDLDLRQLVLLLAGNGARGTTGFVAWRVSQHLVPWLLWGEHCPLRVDSGTRVVELGAGAAGVLAASVGRVASSYVATDLQPVQRLLVQNIANNTTPQQRQRIHACEYDWEDPDTSEVVRLLGGTPDLVVACDTVYNLFLIQPFLCGFQALLGPSACGLIAVQCRDSDMMEEFVAALVAMPWSVHPTPSECLSPALADGYVVYWVLPGDR